MPIAKKTNRGGFARTVLLRPCFRSTSLQPLWTTLNRLSLWGMNIGPAGRVGESGEDWVLRWCLRQTPSGQPFVIIDGGANAGQYASRALAAIGKRLRIFCFEPSPGTFARLSSKLGSRPEVRLMPFGLSDSDCQRNLYSHQGGSAEASLARRDMSHWGITQDRVESVRLRCLTDVCREENISRIDFLKLDIEGHELQAMRGARELLEARRIRFIQFEFGAPNIESRTYFKDLFQLLNPNYRLYRIVHNGLAPIREYSEFLETFATVNFLGVAR